MTKTEQLTIDTFNELYKVGDSVIFTNDKNEQVTAALRFPAEKLNDTGRAVIWLTGFNDAIDLTSVII